MTIYNTNPAFILMLLGFFRNSGGIVLQKKEDICYNFYSIFSEIGGVLVEKGKIRSCAGTHYSRRYEIE